MIKDNYVNILVYKTTYGKHRAWYTNDTSSYLINKLNHTISPIISSKIGDDALYTRLKKSYINKKGNKYW